jgi:hypothetical protein
VPIGDEIFIIRDNEKTYSYNDLNQRVITQTYLTIKTSPANSAIVLIHYMVVFNTINRRIKRN